MSLTLLRSAFIIMNVNALLLQPSMAKAKWRNNMFLDKLEPTHGFGNNLSGGDIVGKKKLPIHIFRIQYGPDDDLAKERLEALIALKKIIHLSLQNQLIAFPKHA
ncbi:hypothetical protein QE152_g38399 [Popillia japonica]|uniref:Uncharacterized protein n=1 Tax=Popillia japonica TaxID=7064 RepID=A0AAW1HWZ2_POPJA